MHWRGSLAVVVLPAEIDIVNGREVDEELSALLTAQRADRILDVYPSLDAALAEEPRAS